MVIQLVIRRIRPEETERVRSLAEVAFRETYQTILSPEQIDYMMEWMYSEESLRSQMTEKENAFYVLAVDGLDAGYMSIERHKNPPADLDGYAVFNLQKLYIVPEYQGLGGGREMLGFAEEQMRSLAGPSARAVYELNVNRYNSAVEFYKRNGLEINREGDFAIGNGYFMNDYIMRKFL